MTKKIALLTSADFPNGPSSDASLAEELSNAGMEPHYVIWNDPNVAWESFDLMLFRSPWDYHRHFDAFMSFLDAVDKKTKVLNSVPVVKWNIHKGYLADLQQQGIDVIPTAFFPKDESFIVASMDAFLGPERAASWRRDIVVKPSVSADGYRTVHIAPEDWNTPETREFVQNLVRERDVMVQPYLTAGVQHGEYALMFFRGEYSHCIRKRPHNGKQHLPSPSSYSSDSLSLQLIGGAADQDVLNFGARVVRAVRDVLHLSEDTLYCRVDVFQHGRPDLLPDSPLCVSEVELIEPQLFFNVEPASSARFARLVAEFLSSKPDGV